MKYLLSFAWILAACSSSTSPQLDATTDTGTADTGGLVLCDPRQVTCERVPPTCFSHDGNIVPGISANGTCYTDRCLTYEECLPIACNPALSSTQCPGRWHCDPTTRMCIPTPCPQC